jgi:hypothetical protein
MPYKIKGKCIYKKNTGKKVGCTKGSVKKYMKALHANINECYDYKNTIITDDKSEASVFFTLTDAPGAELGLVFNLDPDADYAYGVIKNKEGRIERFEDPLEAKQMLKQYGLTPDNVESMGQEAYEQIEMNQQASKTDDGVREESLEFEAFVAKILKS